MFCRVPGCHGEGKRAFEKPILSAFVELQEAEFAAAEKGFTAVKHQRVVGTGYFDAVTTTIERDASTGALKGSTEDEQFFDQKHGRSCWMRGCLVQPRAGARRPRAFGLFSLPTGKLAVCRGHGATATRRRAAPGFPSLPNP